ncbi:Cell division protein FtsZ [Candidatus Kinetoplastibacterium sorsogonicusi]|uniref:Cell division protein FtsZ n=2 Tax=Candidatus Kinetoplastidibacterium kentomonadis TaxID=1576550 RepID=A0A3Q8EUG5_9PROT|nr:Cell division protein FtsZ [Candidatus Kinetoplastibacterium sorsogonicusi]
MNFEILADNPNGTIIKVIGVGGAGGNAVNHMIRSGVKGVDFICANTDAQALAITEAPIQIRLGRSGLGAGAKPDQGRACAETAREDIRNALNGANMVFITAGMGGGTGTGASPIVAEIAKELGILTVGVVTKPFAFEGNRRMRMAEEGIKELSKHVHSLIVVLNEKLYDLLDEDATQEDCFKSADSILNNACAGIAEIINVEGNVNVDFEDVRTIMGEKGQAMMGTATAEGVDRARIAAEDAIACPLLEGVDLHGAKGILVNITSGKSLKMRETREIMETIRSYAAEDATIIFGNAYDDTMGDKLRVTVVATGLGKNLDNKNSNIIDKNIKNSKENVINTNNEQKSDNQVLNKNLRNQASSQIKALEDSGVDHFDIPSFLRKQVD